MNDPLLKLDAIDKSFFGVPVLKNVSMQLRDGQTLGLVGENGAGKSTLMNILGGNLAADAGGMSLNTERYTPRSPRDAERAGVAFIHQELNLFSNLSIAENLFLLHFPRRFGCIDRRQMRRRARKLLVQVGLNLSPKLKVGSLSAGERQLVEIAKALNLNARLIILDEPTTSLTARESERLFELLRTLQQRGIAMIYISHTLSHVQQLCSDVVVLRDGQVVGSGPIDQFDTSRMVSLMVGRSADQQFPSRTSSPADKPILTVQSVSQPGVVHEVSLSLRQSEVVGISGLMGSGRTELARILFGLDPMASGRIELRGENFTHASTRQRIRRGMAMLTESRRNDGLLMDASIADNISLVAAPRFAMRPFGLLRGRELRQQVQQTRASVHLTKTAELNRPVRTLSGGNQQKVVLAKWLLNQPQVLILDEPTRGIDVGSKYEVYRLIDQLAAGGAAVLIISSEIEELIGICDRILVMASGEITDELSRDQFDAERIMQSSLRVPVEAGVA